MNKKINKKISKILNKKIANESAIGIILLVTIIAGGIIWMFESKQLAENQQLLQVTPIISIHKNPIKKAVLTSQSDTSLCTPHYYEGESKVQVWLVSADQENGNSLIIQLKNGEEKKLPSGDVVKNPNFTVKLIDPTAGVRKGLLTSSKEKPVSITIHGYAEICQQPPLVSLQEATVAFKKG
jgi:hypothetical protein